MCNNEEFLLTILQTSDVHGTILPINYSDNSYEKTGVLQLYLL